MGGWLMTLAAKSRPKKIAALLGLATAVDFGKDLYKNLSLKNKTELKINRFTKYTSYGFSYILTKKFFTEANKNNILNKHFRFKKPLILIHGLKDNVVNAKMQKKIIDIVNGDSVQIIYLKSSDHRLSKPEDLITINNAINNIRLLITKQS